MKPPHSFVVEMTHEQFDRLHAAIKASNSQTERYSGTLCNADLTFMWTYSDPFLAIHITQVWSTRARFSPGSLVENDIRQLIDNYIHPQAAQ